MTSLRQWRMERLMSVRALEAASGVTQKTIIDLEYGRRRPNYATMRALSDALGVAPVEVEEFAARLGELGKDAA